MTRTLSRTETINALLFNTAGVGVVVFAVMSIGQWHGPMPGPLDMGLMVALGVLITFGHFLFTAAYGGAPASMLAPVTYLQLFWAGGLGWLIFGHIPDGWSLAGMGLVMVAGTTIALRSHVEAHKTRASGV